MSVSADRLAADPRSAGALLCATVAGLAAGLAATWIDELFAWWLIMLAVAPVVGLALGLAQVPTRPAVVAIVVSLAAFLTVTALSVGLGDSEISDTVAGRILSAGLIVTLVALLTVLGLAGWAAGWAWSHRES